MYSVTLFTERFTLGVFQKPELFIQSQTEEKTHHRISIRN